jgi:hypothetical protein
MNKATKGVDEEGEEEEIPLLKFEPQKEGEGEENEKKRKRKAKGGVISNEEEEEREKKVVKIKTPPHIQPPKKVEKRGRKKKEKTEKDKFEETSRMWWADFVLPKMKEEEAQQQKIKEINTFYGAAINSDDLDENSLNQKALLYRTIDEGRMRMDKIIELILLGRYDMDASNNLLNYYLDKIIEIQRMTQRPGDTLTLEMFQYFRHSDDRAIKFAIIFFMMDNENLFPSQEFLSIPDTINNVHHFKLCRVVKETFLPWTTILGQLTDQYINHCKEVDRDALVEYAVACCNSYLTYNIPPYTVK